MRFARLLLATGLLPLAAPALTAETASFTYDALGRLTASSVAGGPRSGVVTANAFDPAGNRATTSVGPPGSTPGNAASFAIANAAAVDEGQPAIFTITKSGTAVSALSVNYATANGSAAAPGDYSAATGTLTFRSWETVRTVTVPTLTDSSAEAAEQFSLVLSSPSSGALIGTGIGTATINASTAPNQPPVANTDSKSVGVCLSTSFNAVANDTDPEGNYPLALVSVGSSSLGDATVASSTDIAFTAYGSAGSGQFNYVVRDSLGATSTGTVNITVTNGSGCN